jgi:hypothetical protein
MVNWIPPQERQRRDMIRQLCRRHGWTFLELPRSGSSSDDRLIVGVAMWSDYDVQFLEVLQRSSSSIGAALEVFDMDDVRTEEDLQQFIPGGHLPLRTPVVAVIRRGGLTEQLEGDVVLAMNPVDLMRLLNAPYHSSS